MYKTTVKIEGMMCENCEAHVNEAVRRAFKIKKATSSHTAGETVIISKDPLDEDELRAVIGEAGFKTVSVSSECFEEKGFFSFLKK